jgi:hypothetical protein
MSTDFFRICSVDWERAMLAFSLRQMSHVSIEFAGRKITSVEANRTGRLVLDELTPDTEYDVTVAYENGEEQISFKTLPAPDGEMIYSIAALADPHVSIKDENRKGRLFVESGAILGEVASAAEKAACELMIIGGDLTNDSHPPEFMAAKQALQAFTCKIIAAPGDHDIHHGDTSKWHATFGPVSGSYEAGPFQVVSLNTASYMLLDEDRELIEQALYGSRIPLLLTHVHLLENPLLDRGGKHEGIRNLAEHRDLFNKLAERDSFIYAGHQNIPTIVKNGKTTQITMPQTSQYLCGWYLVRCYANGVYNTFMPISSEELRSSSREMSHGAAGFYNESQWAQEYRMGRNLEMSNFLTEIEF